MKRLFLFLSIVLYTFPAFSQNANNTNLKIDPGNSNEISFTALTNEAFELTTTGNDPWFKTIPLPTSLGDKHNVLSFEYFAPRGIDHLQVTFGPDFVPDKGKYVYMVSPSEGWVQFSVDLTEVIGNWGNKGDIIRLDMGGSTDVNMQIRNLNLREMTKREKELAKNKEAKKKQEAVLEQNLRNYLSTDYPCKIESVFAGNENISVQYELSDESDLYLCEIAPWMDVTEENSFLSSYPLTSNTEVTVVERFYKHNDYNYDRLLSKWLIAKKQGDNFILKSHARYADSFDSKYELKDEKPGSQKGLGGFSTSRGHIEDLKELDITSATVNIWFTRFMYTRPAEGRIQHNYNGKSFYFGEKEVAVFDSTFRVCAENNIIVAAILLVSKAEQCPDPEIGRMMQHPDMDPAGIYSMPNMTNPESVECYAAALDFLASRYSRKDKKYGRIHHWIMHNEVDAGWVWTNMGEKTELIFMDAYIKSMRMCYNIARNYNPHSEVFISLTHYWAWTSHPRFYPSKNLMEILLEYTRAEGDFKWALAHHPYPESLREPKTWLDQKVDFTYNSPLITFKNIEVINSWIKQEEVLYQGKEKRTLWLSENGTNSPTYSEQDLLEQAAGFAYTWKKLKTLDGIDGFQWHNWFDSRGEGGLRLGLRRFPDDEVDPGGQKPVWFVYEAAGTENEDKVFDPYKEVIGIDHWDQVIFQGEVDPVKRHAGFRDIQADTWVATDALGRELSGYDQTGPRKDDRFVGMFYFMTHLSTEGDGPYDVSKIKAANPENPQWGKGSHFWGEPEIGYYLNNDEWAIRRHACQLADAGVDVIIFDVTNNKTFPEVYTPVCEVWRELRKKGEKTPDIAFLGSEISVNTLWNDFYKKGMYPELWFMWKGKPLLLYGQHEQPQRNKVNDIVFEDDILNFFSLRQSWAWTSLPWYNDGKDEWPWVDHFPQTIGWHEDPEKAENVPVAVGQHPLSNIGRSFHHFHQPETDKYDLTPFTDQGLHFQEQWNHAIEVDPEFVFVTGWNEWSAGKQIMKEPIIPNLLQWNFYPGAHLGKAGNILKPGDAYFIDQYNQEFSRDIEPMTGGHTDNYYYQLIDNVRKYKGAAKPVKAGSKTRIDINGDFSQWEKVVAVYYDHIGDTEARNHPGYMRAGPYTNNTGRNDIIESRVARDDESIWFYVKTDSKLSSHTDNNWMLLYIDIDQDHDTGWEGYDFLVNKEVLSAQKTTLMKFHKNKWKKSAEIEYRYSDNELMIKIPKNLLGENAVSFDFHWADNSKTVNDINEFFLNGDNAPERRSNYRFTE